MSEIPVTICVVIAVYKFRFSPNRIITFLLPSNKLIDVAEGSNLLSNDSVSLDVGSLCKVSFSSKELEYAQPPFSKLSYSIESLMLIEQVSEQSVKAIISFVCGIENSGKSLRDSIQGSVRKSYGTFFFNEEMDDIPITPFVFWNSNQYFKGNSNQYFHGNKGKSSELILEYIGSRDLDDINEGDLLIFKFEYYRGTLDSTRSYLKLVEVLKS